MRDDRTVQQMGATVKTIDQLAALWNAQADEFNQWPALGLDEMIEFAQDVERERAAKICDDLDSEYHNEDLPGFVLSVAAERIRAPKEQG